MKPTTSAAGWELVRFDQKVLRVLRVAGRPLPAAEIAALLDRRFNNVLCSMLGTLCRRGLIRWQGGGYCC